MREKMAQIRQFFYFVHVMFQTILAPVRVKCGNWGAAVMPRCN
jgi:hypothetical protein